MPCHGHSLRASARAAEASTKHPACRVASVFVTRKTLRGRSGQPVGDGAPRSCRVPRHTTRFQLDRTAIHLSAAPDVDLWVHVADVLGAPAIAAVVIASLVLGALRRILLRVGVFAGFAAAAFVISEHIAKPMVGERFFGELSFPSGNVTAVCATAVAMWIALYPVLGKWSRTITFVFGAAWTLLMSAAVVGAIWHTPLDCVGSVLLSLGVVTAGAAIQPKPARSDGAGAVDWASGSWKGSEERHGSSDSLAQLCLPEDREDERGGAGYECWRTA